MAENQWRRRIAALAILGAALAGCASDPELLPEAEITEPAIAAPGLPSDAPPTPPAGLETAPRQSVAPAVLPEPGGPPLPWDRLVDRLVVHKADRRLYAFIDGAAVKAYEIALGFSPAGHKAFEGDGRTPEGVYFIDRKNAYSRFHLSLGVSYPDRDDRFRAESLGVSPGGNIMIHGFPDEDPLGFTLAHPHRDWTNGCIAVTNREIEELWRSVPLGTPIHIEP